MGELVNDHLLIKEIKKELKKVIFLEIQSDGTYIWKELKQRLPLTVETFEKVKALPWWNEGNILLNELPFEEAVQKLKPFMV